MGLRTIRLAMRLVLGALAGSSTAAPQAAVEYAAKASAGAVSSAAGDLQMGVCRVDASLIRCMHDYYPDTFKVCVVGLGAILIAIIMRTLRATR